jgi:hypothetical protein
MMKRLSLSQVVALISTSAALALLSAASCGGTTSTFTADGGEAGSADGSPASDAADSGDSRAAIPLADAPFACGSATCRVDQFCIVPCCGGAPPQCIAGFDDAGTCPSGFHSIPLGSCFLHAEATCEADPCTPQPRFCVDDPASKEVGYCSQDGPTSSRTVSCICA